MNGETDKPTQQACHIDILFPVTSDDEAMQIKQRISEALKDVEHKRFRFSISEG